MTLVLPAIQDIPAGHIATATDLNQISTAAAFMLNKPIALVTDSVGGQAIGTTYPPTADISFGAKTFDTDGMWSSGTPTRLTAQTPGFYRFYYSVSSQSAGGPLHGGLWVTTGSNNPAGSGVVLGPFWGTFSAAGTTVGTTTSGMGIVPFYLYQGDWVHVRAYAASGTMTTNTINASHLGLEWMSI